jgi:hypothetical protein
VTRLFFTDFEGLGLEPLPGKGVERVQRLHAYTM